MQFRKIRHSRKKAGRLLLLLPLLTVALHTRAQQPVFQTVQFDNNQLSTTSANMQPFLKVAYEGLGNDDGTPGAPSLPVRYLQIIVPRDVNYSDITVNPGNFVDVPLYGQMIYPAQTPIPTSDQHIDYPFVPPDPEYYQSSAPYPSSLVKYVREGYFDGDKHIITLAVYPAQYLPFSASLRFYTDISFTLNPNMQAQGDLSSIGRAPISLQSVYDNGLASIVYNTSDIPVFGGGGPIFAGSGGTSKFYEYVVITSHELRPAFEELVGWKRTKGLNAGIVEIEDIVSDPAYSSGDLVSHINDDAGRLRAYLKDAYGHGTVYAVLGGDPSIVPVRYAAGSINNYDNGGPDESHIPSDLYFADFNGNWNADGDLYYGEDYEDKVDYNPEIFVGRMMVRTQMEAVNHIHKVIRYERNPGRGDNDYLARAFMTQSDEMQDYTHEAPNVATHMPFFAPGDIKIWGEVSSGGDPAPTGPVVGDVVTEISKYYGLVSIFGHGNPWSIGIRTGGYNGCNKDRIATLDDADNLFYCPTPGGMPNNGLDNLDDFDHRTKPYHYYPYLFYSVACSTIPYDTELDGSNMGPASDIHFGDQFVNLSKAGVAAYIGNSRNGWVGSSSRLQSAFMDQVTAGNSRLGVAHGLSKASYNDTWCDKTNSLIGCPETDMWTGKPATFSSASVSAGGIPGYPMNVTVNTGGVADATIAVTSAFDNGVAYSQRTTTSASSYTFLGVPSNFTVCITKHNYVPFIASNSQVIQNTAINNPAYIASANNISAGQSVNPSQPTGPVVIKNGSNVYFHADNNGTVLLDKGFEVEQGAAFEAK